MSIEMLCAHRIAKRRETWRWKPNGPDCWPADKLKWRKCAVIVYVMRKNKRHHIRELVMYSHVSRHARVYYEFGSSHHCCCDFAFDARALIFDIMRRPFPSPYEMGFLEQGQVLNERAQNDLSAMRRVAFRTWVKREINSQYRQNILTAQTHAAREEKPNHTARRLEAIRTEQYPFKVGGNKTLKERLDIRIPFKQCFTQQANEKTHCKPFWTWTIVGLLRIMKCVALFAYPFHSG